MPEFLKDLGKDLGLTASLSTAVAWLWSSGFAQWIPALLVAVVGVCTLLLNQRLPWQRIAYQDLGDLLKGQGTHRQLLPKLRQACANAQYSQAPTANPPAGSRWMRGMADAQHRLDAWLGPQIWTYQGFNKLLLFAVAYPILFLLLVWWWTDVGTLGQATVLPSLGQGVVPFMQRTAFVLLTLWPLLWAWWVKRQRPQWLNVERHWGFMAFWVFAVGPAGLLFEYGPIQFAVAFGSASAISIAIAIANIGGFEIASAVASGIAIASSIAFSVIIDSASAFTVLGASLVAVVLMLDRISNRLDSCLRTADRTLAHACAVMVVCGLLLLVAGVCSTRPLWWSFSNQTSKGLLLSGILLFGLAWMPIINALFDWVSLGITRELLCRMTKSPAWMWGGLVLDVLAGVLLTLALLFVALVVLHFLQWCGWPVDAQAVRLAFVHNPLDPQVSWLAMLAFTNMLPTLWHVGVSLWGLLDRQFTHDASHLEHLRQLNDALDDQGNIRPGATIPPLGDLDTSNLFNSLFVHPWLYVGTVLALWCGLWGSYLEVLRWVLTLWPSA